MSKDYSTDLLSALPRTRPHRRSKKRPARGAPAERPTGSTANGTRAKARSSRREASGAAPRKQTGATSRAKRTTTKAGTRRQIKRLPQPPQPEGTPTRAPAGPVSRTARPVPVPVVTTAVQAVGELAEIGLSLGARALRGAIDRLPRP